MNTSMKERLRGKLKEKTAAGLKLKFKKKDVKRLGRNIALLGGAGLAIAGGITAGEKGYELLSDPIKKSIGKKRMYAENPWLKKESPKDVGKFYNTLFRFSPNMAADPVTSGSFMKRVLEFKDLGIQSADVKALTEVESNIRGRRTEGILTSAFSPQSLGSLSSGLT